MNKKNKLFLVLLVVLFFIFLVLSYFFLTSSSIFNKTPGPNAYEDEIEQPEPEKSTEISELYRITPYYGKYFSLIFDRNEGLYFAYIDPSHEDEGNKEFSEFLIQNGIPDRSFFPSLEISVAPLPTPGSE